MGNCGILKYELLFVEFTLLNKKSHDPRSPSYVPSIFPSVYQRKVINQDQQNARYERSKNRQTLELNSSSAVTTNAFESSVENNGSPNGQNKTIHSICTQVSFDVIENNFIFNCEFEGNNAGTQVTIPNNFVTLNKPKTEDQSCGIESLDQKSCLSCNTFQGFQSIESEQSLKDIIGITFKIFDFLLSLIPYNIDSQTILSKENFLLIFSMKLKLGLTYSASGVFFKVHRTTISRVFIVFANFE